MGGKFLFVLLVAVAIYLLLRQRRRGGPRERKSTSPRPPPAEVMVSCEHCGLHIPASESLQVGGRYYCSEEHRRLGAGQAGK